MNRAEKRRQQKLAEKQAKKNQRRKTSNTIPAQQPAAIQQALELAVNHQKAGQLPQAEAIYKKILADNPQHPLALQLLGTIALQSGRHSIAVDYITRALAIKPDSAEAHNNLGSAFKGLGQLDDAIASFRRAVAIKPNYATAHHNLANTLMELGQVDEAIASFSKTIAIKPDYAEAHNNLGIALMDLGKVDEAIAHYSKAIAIKPGLAEAHNNLGHALKDLGKLNDAVASFRQAIAIKPDYALAHRHLAQCKKHTEYDNDIKAMEASFTNTAISDAQRMHLAFGLGTAFENLQQYEKAFEFFLTGNTIKRGTFDYDIEAEALSFNKLKAAFTETLFLKHQNAGSTAATPIFILGMPRSGTSLVEQIMASHPNVYGAGELANLNKIVTAFFEKDENISLYDTILQADDHALTRLGNEYTNMLGEYPDSVQFITDKMPSNFKWIGMIKLILPNAKIIHCCRDPLDTCLSIFKNYFPKGYYYSFSLTELGQYYKLYRDMMRYWHNLLPGLIYDIQYEDLVANQAAQSRALLDHCGLEWNEACLDFHRTNRPVRTTSAVQVRKPIYQDSVQAWRRYEKQLAPLIDILDDD